MTDRSYYKKQLENLNFKYGDYVNMKFYGDNGESKYLGLNKDSLFELIDFCVRNEIVNVDDIDSYLK